MLIARGLFDFIEHDYGRDVIAEGQRIEHDARLRVRPHRRTARKLTAALRVVHLQPVARKPERGANLGCEVALADARPANQQNRVDLQGLARGLGAVGHVCRTGFAHALDLGAVEQLHAPRHAVKAQRMLLVRLGLQLHVWNVSSFALGDALKDRLPRGVAHGLDGGRAHAQKISQGREDQEERLRSGEHHISHRGIQLRTPRLGAHQQGEEQR